MCLSIFGYHISIVSIKYFVTNKIYKLKVFTYLLSDYYEDDANVYVPLVNRPRDSDVHLDSENKRAGLISAVKNITSS